MMELRTVTGAPGQKNLPRRWGGVLRQRAVRERRDPTRCETAAAVPGAVAGEGHVGQVRSGSAYADEAAAGSADPLASLFQNVESVIVSTPAMPQFNPPPDPALAVFAVEEGRAHGRGADAHEVEASSADGAVCQVPGERADSGRCGRASPDERAAARR